MVTAAPPVPAAGTRRQSVVLHGLDWTTYAGVLAAFGDHRFRHTYDRGRLEIMSPLYWHDTTGRVLAILVRGLAAEFGRKVKSAGSTTLRREEMDRGLEPDECFYIGNFAAVQGRTELDFDVDPPPDLAVEVDHTRNCIDRLPVYAALGVPEVWRYDDGAIEFRRLGADGYAVVAESPTFPGIPPAALADWVRRAAGLDDNELTDLFRGWVRQQLGRQP
jgi:Uma2 family endonuclease